MNRRKKMFAIRGQGQGQAATKLWGGQVNGKMCFLCHLHYNIKLMGCNKIGKYKLIKDRLVAELPKAVQEYPGSFS